jgi:DNA-binding protein Fis
MTKTLVQLGLDRAGRDATDVHRIVIEEIERELITQVVHACGGVQTKAATKLGMNRNTLHKKIKEYGLGD